MLAHWHWHGKWLAEYASHFAVHAWTFSDTRDKFEAVMTSRLLSSVPLCHLQDARMAICLSGLHFCSLAHLHGCQWIAIAVKI